MGLFYIFLSIVLLGVACYVWDYRRRADRAQSPEKQEPDGECCGQHAVCEKESLLAAASKEIVYYDDEELDRFKGKVPDEYTAEETAEFEDVFYTLAADDVAGWVRSLHLRGIELPIALTDEVLLVVGERRME
ncbi:MAG: phospholipase [Coprobacter sp.]|nr:phospholipase [Coprobacter sp.]